MKKILRNLFFFPPPNWHHKTKKKPNNTEAYKWNERQKENRDIHTVVFISQKKKKLPNEICQPLNRCSTYANVQRTTTNKQRRQKICEAFSAYLIKFMEKELNFYLTTLEIKKTFANTIETFAKSQQKWFWSFFFLLR